MQIILLGTGAGGGMPQWNCGCTNCRTARARGRGRTQSSVAVSADGERWILLNASPDLRVQLAAHAPFWPREVRDSPIRAVVLTDGEIDHTLGLLLLREGTSRMPVYAPSGVAGLLSGPWPLTRVLEPYCGIDLRPLPPRRAAPLQDTKGQSLGLTCTAVPLARRAPRYAPHAANDDCEVGLRIQDPATGGTFAYVPVAGRVDDEVCALAADADLLCFDGTFWSDDELGELGISAPSARAMGHVPLGGPDGSLERLSRVGAKRTVLVHINNTNPILAAASPERTQVAAAGVEIGEDGMHFTL
ncbi:MAG TPA: pyrroloquinoline quinone biosynthesis protein PqqB [Gemmatimonadales bacterium]|nr:pyrroloquinoline quinone biosynthesis protein PqqB [Gemmatimonadales bacterium]